MNRSQKIYSIATLLLLNIVVLTPPAILAQSDTPSATPPLKAQPGTQEPTKDPLAIYRLAGIDKQQEEKIRQLAKSFEDVNLVRLQGILNLQQEMRALSLKPDPDEQTIIAKQTEINKLQAQMSIERIQMLLKIRQLLQPEQKQRLVELMQKN